MSWVNLYKPPVSTESSGSIYGPDPYDINYSLPIYSSTLESDRVKLIPFIPSQHATAYFACAEKYPDVDLLRYLPTSLPTDNFLRFIEEAVRRNPFWVLFTIIDKITESDAEFAHLNLGGSVAGIIGLIYCSPQNLSAEIGPVIVLPPFQRTFVSTNAIGLMLRYCFNLPDAPLPGLGFRRVQWTANPLNAASVRTAERMGFKVEGKMRWVWVLEADKEGNVRKEGEKLGRDSVLLAMCFDDWENGGVSKHIDRMIERSI